MTIRLNKVTRDLNVGIATVVEFLQKKGQIKILDIAGILHHVAVVVIFKTADAVDVDAGDAAVAEQPFLIIHAVSVKQFNRIVRILAPLHDGNLLFHVLMHPGLHTVNQPVSYTHLDVYKRQAQYGVYVRMALIMTLLEVEKPC